MCGCVFSVLSGLCSPCSSWSRSEMDLAHHTDPQGLSGRDNAEETRSLGHTDTSAESQEPSLSQSVDDLGLPFL